MYQVICLIISSIQLPVKMTSNTDFNYLFEFKAPKLPLSENFRMIVQVVSNLL